MKRIILLILILFSVAHINASELSGGLFNRKTKNGDIDTFTVTVNNIQRFVIPKGAIAVSWQWNDDDIFFSYDNMNFLKMENDEDVKEYSKKSKLFFLDITKYAYYLKSENNNIEVNYYFPSDDFISQDSNNNSGIIVSKLNIVSRSQWGADDSINTWPVEYYPVNKIVIHHTVTSPNVNYADVVRTIFNYHAYTKGWTDIGYNYLVDPNGVIYEGRLGGEGTVGGHVYGYNYGSIGIAMIGDFTNSPPSQQALDSLDQLIAEKSVIYGFNPVFGQTVFGHRDLGNTACPGNTFYPIIPDQINIIQNYINNDYTDYKNIREVSYSQTESYTNNEILLIYNDQDYIFDLNVYDYIPKYSGITSYRIVDNSIKININSYAYQDNSVYRTRLLYYLFALNNQKVELYPYEFFRYKSVNNICRKYSCKYNNEKIEAKPNVFLQYLKENIFDKLINFF